MSTDKNKFWNKLVLYLPPRFENDRPDISGIKTVCNLLAERCGTVTLEKGQVFWPQGDTVNDQPIWLAVLFYKDADVLKDALIALEQYCREIEVSTMSYEKNGSLFTYELQNKNIFIEEDIA